jgi:phosphate starvation-inducible protein PhoH
MGRKNRSQRKARKAQYIEEQEDEKAYEALTRVLEPEWWNRADSYQQNFDSAIEYYNVTGVNAPAGTGKTTIAVKKGLEAIRSGKCDTLRYVRFVDQRTQKLGFLPGNPAEKERGFMYPLFDALEECGLQPEHIAELLAHEVIEASTDIFMRGRNLKRTFLIVDECQNGDIEDIRTVFTRLHKQAGKLVILGHSAQVDRKLKRYGKAKLTPFEVYMYHMSKKPFTKICELKTNYRGEISQWADEIDQTIKELEADES